MELSRPPQADEALYFDIIRAGLVMRRMTGVSGGPANTERALLFFRSARVFRDDAIERYDQMVSPTFPSKDIIIVAGLKFSQLDALELDNTSIN